MRYAISAMLSLWLVTGQALDTKPYLNLDLAKRMADAREGKAAAEGWRRVDIASYDDGGNLTLFPVRTVPTCTASKSRS